MSRSAFCGQVRSRGISGSALPPFHAITVTVPGAAAAWEDAAHRWGTLPLSQARRIWRLLVLWYPATVPCPVR